MAAHGSVSAPHDRSNRLSLMAIEWRHHDDTTERTFIEADAVIGRLCCYGDLADREQSDDRHFAGGDCRHCRLVAISAVAVVRAAHRSAGNGLSAGKTVIGSSGGSGSRCFGYSHGGTGCRLWLA